jgi:hypothetical protein
MLLRALFFPAKKSFFLFCIVLCSIRRLTKTCFFPMDNHTVITLDGRGKIPTDKAGIGFPWGNPIVSLYKTLLPRSLRMMIISKKEKVESRLISTKEKVVQSVKQVLGLKRSA